MRYYLEQQNKGLPHAEVMGQRKKTRAEVDDWIAVNERACGLDWRAGYTIKFRDSDTIYVWRKLKNHETVC